MRKLALVLVLGIVLSSVAQADLIAYWPMEEAQVDSGFGWWIDMTLDASGNGFDLDVNGATLTTSGYQGNALVYDGADDHLYGAHAELDITTALTVSAWVQRASGGSGGYDCIAGKGDFQYMLRTNDGGRVEFFTHDGGWHQVNGATIPIDEWHHVAGVCDGSTVQVYVDGVPGGSASGGITSDPDAFNVGRNSSHTGRLFEGAIDEVAIWNEALDLTAIQFLAAGGSPLAALPAELTWDHGTQFTGNWGIPNWVSSDPTAPPFPTIAEKAIVDDGDVTVAASRGALALEHNGGGITVGAGNTLTVATVLTSAPGSVLTLGNGSTLAVGSGNIATLQTDGSATVNASGNVAVSGATFDGGGATGTFTKTGAGTLTLDNTGGAGVIGVQNMTFDVQDGTLHGIGTQPLGGTGPSTGVPAGIDLSGGKLTLEGEPTTVYNRLNYAFYDNAANTELAAIDDGIDNDANGGLFTLTPTTSSAWTGEVWQAGNMDDTYCQMWSGQVHVPVGMGGDFTVYVHGDDYELFWLDVGQDGDFNAGVDDISRNLPPEGWNTPHTETVTLAGGQTYDFAIAHSEGGGGDWVNVEITPPAFTSIPAFRINPSDPDQAGLWSAPAPGAINMPGTPITVAASSELEIIATSAALGALTLNPGTTLTTLGDPMTFVSSAFGNGSTLAAQGTSTGLGTATVAGSATIDNTGPVTATTLTLDNGDQINFVGTGSATIDTLTNAGGTSVMNVTGAGPVTVLDVQDTTDGTVVKQGLGTLVVEPAGPATATRTGFQVDPGGPLHAIGGLDGSPLVTLNGGKLIVQGVPGGGPLPAGATAHWALDESSGATAVDSAGTHAGTLNGNPVWQPTGGRIGGALLFDGSGDYVESDTGIDLRNTSFSAALWVNRDTLDTDWLIGQGDSTGTRQALHIGFRDADTIALGFYGDDLNHDNAAAVGDTTDWHHWAFTYDAATGTQRIYIDGALDASRTAGGHFEGSGLDPLWLARRWDGQDFAGLLDDVVVYEGHELTAPEVQQIYNRGAFGAVNMTATDVRVTASSELEAISDVGANLGALTIESGKTLTTTGDPMTFVNTTFGNGSTLAGQATSTGLGPVTLAGSSATIDATGLVTIDTLPLDNGEQMNFVGSGPVTIDALINTGGTITLNVTGTGVASASDYSEPGGSNTVLKQGAGEFALDGISPASAANTTFQVDAGTLGALGASPVGNAPEVILNGGILAVTGGPVATIPDAIDHYGYHINDDNLALDLDGNGGMMGGGDPATFTAFEGRGLLTDGPGNRGLDFNNDADFRAVPASILDDPSGDGWVIDQNDNYSNLWLGTLHVDPANAGDWGFRNRGDDDRGGIWLDLDQDGVFESSTPGLGDNRGEQISWENGGWKTHNLAAGDYLVAFTHREGGGGSRADFAIRQSVATGGSEWIVKPGDAAQAGLWSAGPAGLGGPIDVTDTPIDVIADSGVSANTFFPPAQFGDLTFYNNSTLTTSGSDMTFTSARIEGGAGRTGTLETENNVTIDDYSDGGVETHFGKAGQGTLTMDNFGGGVVAPATTYEVHAGTLRGIGPNQLGTPPEVVLNGGELLVEGAPVTVGAIAHYGYHINNDNLALDLNGNAGMMGGGDPTLGPSYYGQAVLTDGPGGRGLDFNNDADFTATGAVGQNDNYSNLFVGMIHVTPETAGNWELRIAQDDDRSGIWLDLDQNGVFDSTGGLGSNRNEQLRWESGSSAVIGLTAGDYMLGVTHREGGGGSGIEARILTPGMTVEETIKPTAISQFGIWAPVPFAPAATIDLPGAIDMTGTDITVTADSRLTAISYGGADFGTVTVHDGAALTTGGDTPDITFLQAILPGGRSTYKPEVPTFLTVANGLANPGGATSTLVAAGKSDLILNKPPVDSMANVTLEGKSGRLYADYNNGDPTGGADINLTGGTFTAEGAVVSTPGLTAGSHSNSNWKTDANPGNLGICAVGPEGMIRDGRLGDIRENHWGAAHGDDGGNGPGNTALIYTGQVYLTPGDWTFIEQNDDNTLVRVGGTTIMDVGSWNNANRAVFTATLDDGSGGAWYDFEARFQNGGGGYGFSGQQNTGQGDSNWNNIGNSDTDPDGICGFRFAAGNIGNDDAFNYNDALDPGDGSIFRVRSIGALDIQNTLTVDNQPASALRHLGYHTGPNGVMDLDNNNTGGMMGGGDPTQGPTFFSEALLTDGPGGRGLDFNDDNDFIATGAIGQNDNYSNLWLATLHVDPANAGDWEFRNRGDDDRAGIWLDLDQDGIFESTTPGLATNNGEQLSWEDGGWKTVSLAAGDYLVAFTHSEGGGGSRADFAFRNDVVTAGAEWVIKPADAGQAGLWSTTPTSTLELITDAGANLSELILKSGDLKITGGPGLTIQQASIHSATSGTVGLITETPTILTDVLGFDGNGQTVEITKGGSADLILNKPGTNLDGATFVAQGGRLVGVHDAGNPFGNAAFDLGGGELALSSAGGPVAFDNPTAVTRDSILTACAAGGGVPGQIVTLGSAGNGVSLGAGTTVITRSQDGCTLDVAGPLSGSGGVHVTEGDVDFSGGGIVGSLMVTGGTANTGTTSVAIAEGGQMTLGDPDGYSSIYTATTGAFSVKGPINNQIADTVIGGGPGAVLTIGNTKGTILSRDIGGPGQAGTFSETAPGEYTIEGGGGDIWGNSDAFHYAFQPVSGDCEMIARVSNPENTNTWAKAGLMIREGLDGGSKNTFTARTPTTGQNRITFQRRTSDGGGSSSEHTNGFTDEYYWLRILRVGDTFSGYWAPDVGGVPGTWTQRGSSRTFSMASDAFIGMAVTAHNNGTLCATVFDNVTGFALGDFPTSLYNLAGEGTVVADNGIVLGGTLGPGDGGPGKLTMQGDLTFEPTATFEVDILGAVAGDDYDQVAFQGDGNSPTLNDALLDLFTPIGTFQQPDVGLILTLMDIGDPLAFADGIFSYVNPLNGLTEALPEGTLMWDQNGAYNWHISYNSFGAGNDVQIRLNAIPEPATMALLGLGALALLRRRRRQA